MALPALQIAMASTAVHCAIAFSPVLVYAAFKKSKPVFIACALVTLLDLLQAFVLFLPIPYPRFLGFLHYNWIQKALVSLISLVLMLKLKEKCGLNIPSKGSGFALAILIGIAFAALDVFMNQANIGNVDRETIFYQLTMPGLQEEIMYRGLMLYFLDDSLGTPWKFAGVRFGVGALITSALFSFGHLVIFDVHWNLIINPDILSWINQFLFALVMCWLRYFTKSAWTCVLAHNLDNGILSLKLFFSG